MLAVDTGGIGGLNMLFLAAFLAAARVLLADGLSVNTGFSTCMILGEK